MYAKGAKGSAVPSDSQAREKSLHIGVFRTSGRCRCGPQGLGRATGGGQAGTGDKTLQVGPAGWRRKDCGSEGHFGGLVRECVCPGDAGQ
uniref:Uncharacterized protein n=1 Tax=Castor canadensis TaxID=51338 RepID=A0A8C0ZMP2_CASCN